MYRLHVIAAASTALVAGCGSDPRPPPRLAAAVTTTASDASPHSLPAPPGRQDIRTPSSGSIHIDDKILHACGDLPAAHFAFDSAAVPPEAATTLDALARCFTTGALAGRSMLLMGHTDSRGEVEYNLALGQRRAGSVAGYLAERGLARTHLGTTSRGEFDAMGTDDEGRARDRKVDVTLVE
jgi:peptidoglycan-associated lipoprotein